MKRLLIAAAIAGAFAAPAATAATQAAINTAIDKGLGHLSATQQAGGYWNYGGYEPAATGAAAYAMLSQKDLWGANATTYQAQVDKAMAYLLANATKQTVSTRNDGVNICGGGTCDAVYWNAASDEDTYTTGLIAPAIALYAKSNPSAVATTTGPLAGLTWSQIGQGINNAFAASQSTVNQGANLRGGWRYMLGGPTYDSDMSTTQWASVSMTYNGTLGATTPAILKTDLANFLSFTQNATTGAGCYQGVASGLCDHSDTGGLLLSLSFIGKSAADPAAQKAIGFLNSNWNEGANGWYGNFGHPYAMWSVYKGLETTIGLGDKTSISLAAGACGTLDAGTDCNWWQDYNDWLVLNQGADGGWAGYYYWGDTLSTSFYLPILGGAEIPTTNPVPEPSTYAMMLLGLASIGWFVRRSQRT